MHAYFAQVIAEDRQNQMRLAAERRRAVRTARQAKAGTHSRRRFRRIASTAFEFAGRVPDQRHAEAETVAPRNTGTIHKSVAPHNSEELVLVGAHSDQCDSSETLSAER
jgi:hypothetical protein